MKKIVAAVACSLALSTPAAASLTPSEAAQVREFVQTAQPPNAARLRALVARADLTNEESGASLEAPMAPVVFNDTRSAFLREVVFGGASLASRSVLVAAAVRGALSRANEVLARYPADLDQHADALVELQRIYGFWTANSRRRAGAAVSAKSRRPAFRCRPTRSARGSWRSTSRSTRDGSEPTLCCRPPR